MSSIFEKMENIKSENRQQDIYLKNSKYMTKNEGYIPRSDYYSKPEHHVQNSSVVNNSSFPILNCVGEVPFTNTPHTYRNLILGGDATQYTN